MKLVILVAAVSLASLAEIHGVTLRGQSQLNFVILSRNYLCPAAQELQAPVYSSDVTSFPTSNANEESNAIEQLTTVLRFGLENLPGVGTIFSHVFTLIDIFSPPDDTLAVIAQALVNYVDLAIDQNEVETSTRALGGMLDNLLSDISAADQQNDKQALDEAVGTCFDFFGRQGQTSRGYFLSPPEIRRFPYRSIFPFASQFCTACITVMLSAEVAQLTSRGNTNFPLEAERLVRICAYELPSEISRAAEERAQLIGEPTLINNRISVRDGIVENIVPTTHGTCTASLCSFIPDEVKPIECVGVPDTTSVNALQIGVRLREIYAGQVEDEMVRMLRDAVLSHMHSYSQIYNSFVPMTASHFLVRDQNTWYRNLPSGNRFGMVSTEWGGQLSFRSAKITDTEGVMSPLLSLDESLAQDADHGVSVFHSKDNVVLLRSRASSSSGFWTLGARRVDNDLEAVWVFSTRDADFVRFKVLPCPGRSTQTLLELDLPVTGVKIFLTSVGSRKELKFTTLGDARSCFQFFRFS